MPPIICYSSNSSQFPNVPYVGFYKFSTPAILLRDPDLIKDILIKDHFSFHGNDFMVNERDDPLLSKNPFFTRDEQWKRGRVLLLPLFTISKVRTARYKILPMPNDGINLI